MARDYIDKRVRNYAIIWHYQYNKSDNKTDDWEVDCDETAGLLLGLVLGLMLGLITCSLVTDKEM